MIFAFILAFSGARRGLNAALVATGLESRHLGDRGASSSCSSSSNGSSWVASLQYTSYAGSGGGLGGTPCWSSSSSSSSSGGCRMDNLRRPQPPLLKP